MIQRIVNRNSLIRGLIMAPVSTLAVLVLSFSSFAFVSSVGVDVLKNKNKIRCKEVTPSPTTWWKDGEVIDTGNDKYQQIRGDSGSYCLTFNFTTDDEGNYSCIDDSDATQLTVGPQITGSSFNATFDDDGNIRIPCGIKLGSITAVDGLKEGMCFKKSKENPNDRIRIDEGKFEKEREGDSYNVFFVVNSSQYESLSNSDTYFCRLKIEPLNKNPHNFSLRVPPRVTYRDDDDGNATLESGQRLSVLCDANHPDANSSTSITKEWKKDGEALSNESQLVIESLSPKDSGIYTCSASFDGLENKKSFHLTVVDPSPSPSQTRESPSPSASSLIMISISTTSSNSEATSSTSSATVSATSTPEGSSRNKDTLIYAIIIIVLLIAVMLLLAVMTLCYLLHCCMKRKKQRENESGSRMGDAELQTNQNQDSLRPALTPSMASANDRLTIASSSYCESCRCTPSIASSPVINTIQSDQCSLGHNPNNLVGSVSNNSSHCSSNFACPRTCRPTHSNCAAPACCTTRLLPHIHHHRHPPLPQAVISFKPVNLSIGKISHDSGYSVHYTPSETEASRVYPDTQTVCSHCVKSHIISIDSGYHPMITSSLPGYSEGTVC